MKPLALRTVGGQTNIAPINAQVNVAVLEEKKGTPGALVGRDITADEKKSTGQVLSRETAPKITQVGVYHKDKATSPAMQLLNKGFEADKAGKFAFRANLMLGLGAASAIGGAVWFLLAGDSSSTALVPMVSPDGAGLALSGSF